MTVELICVGTEILLGDIVNTNAAFLSRECAALGLNMYTQSVVGDNDARLAKLYREAIERSEVVILTGGLGPTEDDLTKETVCKVLGLELVEDPKARKNIDKILTKYNKPTPNNYKQALVPKKCDVLYNDNGTAPGLYIEKDEHVTVLLPGPPFELIPMFNKQVAPKLAKLSKDTLHSVTIKEIGVGESQLETRILDLIDAQSNPTIATYAKDSYSMVRVTARARNEAQAEALCKPIVKEIKSRLGDAVFTTKADEEIEDVVVKLLKKYELKCATAESCTGGLVAAKLVNVPGASEVFPQGFVTYSNKSKRKVLDVNKDTLKKYTAVSRETAKEMVKGCIFAADADVAVAVTGYAGPDDTPEEPMGLVYIAVSVKDKIVVEKFTFAGNRQKIRERAAVSALDMLRKAILAAYK